MVYYLMNADGRIHPSETKGLYGGHRKLKIYGRLDCPSALHYIGKGQYVSQRVFFKDEITALAAGYRPCGICMKEHYRLQVWLRLHHGRGLKRRHQYTE